MQAAWFAVAAAVLGEGGVFLARWRRPPANPFNDYLPWNAIRHASAMAASLCAVRRAPDDQRRGLRRHLTGGATCPVEQLPTNVRIELKTRTETYSQKTPSRKTRRWQRIVQLSWSRSELSRKRGQTTPWCVQNIREGLSEGPQAFGRGGRLVPGRGATRPSAREPVAQSREIGVTSISARRRCSSLICGRAERRSKHKPALSPHLMAFAGLCGTSTMDLTLSWNRHAIEYPRPCSPAAPAPSRGVP